MKIFFSQENAFYILILIRKYFFSTGSRIDYLLILRKIFLCGITNCNIMSYNPKKIILPLAIYNIYVILETHTGKKLSVVLNPDEL